MKHAFPSIQIGLSSNRRGVVATEAAVVLPLLITLALGAMDFGRVLGVACEFSNAIRAGAESGAVHRPTSLTYDSWELRILNTARAELLDSNQINADDATITVALANDLYGARQVQVSGQYVFRTIVSWPLLPNQVTLRARTVMRQYR